jgi:8-oxo-dGTP diphosphatase
MAIIKKDELSIQADTRYTWIDWFDVDKLPELAYDHKEIIHYALERLKWKMQYSTIAISLLPKEFTLTELQSVFETVLWEEIDKRNFRKKILKQKILTETDKKKTIWLTRPAKLYKSKCKNIRFVEMI